MGLDTKATQFLLTARGSGVSFERIATIGRQRLCVTPAWLRARLHAAGARARVLQTTVYDTC